METEEGFSQKIAAHLPLRERAALREAIEEAYRDACHAFDVEAGADMQLFGFTVYKYVAHRIRRAIEAQPDLELSVVHQSTGAFRIRAGELLVAPYSCGRHAPTDPWREFPGNDRGAGLLADLNCGQFELFCGFDEQPVALVLAHYGSPTSGLVAVYLKRPIAQYGGQISAWDYVEELPAAAGSAIDQTHRQRNDVLPGPTTVVRPTMLPFRRPLSDITEPGNA